ncbi:Malonyl- -acyl carrier mitochondrial [Chlorella sorokiniana]|uniref:Malonyl--acyl carrier mitochondrial n=1 Tax=Chlorella sorokiniana TaxID=3076 RepID=A0A2P6U5F5_CHLSO|nr:Malonyl- -acyl carrier mitochondrial [Chlorella sorokiniana]|eukprot:PRW61553.1 Malonyl- -acyl carrier mitochondrial [Chlorella sorokiniana]
MGPAVEEGAPAVDVLIEDGLRKAINGYTWPGIEFGEPPSCKHTFFEPMLLLQYVDALRFGDLERFRRIEAATQGWYWPELDRGAGAALHFACDHGQLEAVRFLVFEYLLQKGADPSLKSFSGPGPTPALKKPEQLPQPPLLLSNAQGELGVLDVATSKGFGWEPGAVRAELSRLIEQYRDVPKAPPTVYYGPGMAAPALALMAAWESLPKLYPPSNWRPPPPAGYVEAQGIRLASKDPWRPAGENDGSAWLRPMTKEELAYQSANC